MSLVHWDWGRPKHPIIIGWSPVLGYPLVLVLRVDPPAASALLSASLRHVYGMPCKATEPEVANLDLLEALL